MKILSKLRLKCDTVLTKSQLTSYLVVKAYWFPPKIRNKFIQHYGESSFHCNKIRKRHGSHSDWGKSSKLVLFKENMIFYVEDLKRYAKKEKLPEVIMDFRKFARQKMDLFSCKKQEEIEINKIIPIAIILRNEL